MVSYNNDNQKIALQFFVRFFHQWDTSFPNRTVDFLLKPLEITREGILNKEQQVNLSIYYRVLQLAAHTCQGSGFFVQLGNSYDIFDLGIMGYALISSANLQRSWEVSSALIPHPIHTTRNIIDQRVEIELTPQTQDSVQSLALCEEWLIGTWKWTCQRLPEISNCPDVRINLKYPQPKYSKIYGQIFPGTVAFDQTKNSLSFPEKYNEFPFSSASSSVSKLCFEHSISTRPLNNSSDDLADNVSRYLLETVNISKANIDTAAQHFAMPTHTFRRRLANQNVTFKSILLDARMVLSKQYLLATNLSIYEISYLTGYEHPSSFHRAFQKYFKTSPEAFRKKKG